MNGNNFTIFVHGNKQHGVVGLQGALITCFICDHQRHNCEDVTKVAESEETMEHKMPDFLVDFFAERNFQESTESVAAATICKEGKIRSVSCKKKYHSMYHQHKKVFSSGRCSLWQNVNDCFGAAYSHFVSLLPKVFMAVRLHKLCAF